MGKAPGWGGGQGRISSLMRPGPDRATAAVSHGTWRATRSHEAGVAKAAVSSAQILQDLVQELSDGSFVFADFDLLIEELSGSRLPPEQREHIVDLHKAASMYP